MSRAFLSRTVLLTVLVANPVLGSSTSGTTTTGAVEASEPLRDGSTDAQEEDAKEAAVAKKAAAHRAEAERRAGWQAAALFAYGLHSADWGSIDSRALRSVSASSVGAGLRAGYVFAVGLYLGAAFVHHFGQSRDVAGGTVEAGVSYGGVELGENVLALGPLIARPFFGVGPASVTLKAPADGTTLDASGYGVAVWAGLTMLLSFGEKDSLFAGADGRFTGVFRDASYGGWTFAATGGVRF
jgi:hypothetical protein